ncbi:FMN-binding protein [Eubacteriales bacterium KG125]
MVKINNFFKSIIALIAIVVMCLFFSQIKTFAVSTDNNKVTIKYEFVTKSELSKDEISHLKKGIPDIRAQKDAEYLMVYEDASTNSNLHSASKTRTGDSSYLPIYLIITVGSVFFGFLIYRKKHKSVEIKGNIALILMAGLLFAVPFAATQQVNAYTNKNLSKYNKIEKLNIGEKLFQNIPTIENNQSGSFIGVINKADLKGNIPTNPGATQPDVPVQPDVKPDVPVQPDVKPDVPVQPDVKPDVPVQPDVKPDVPVQPDVKPDVPVQPDVKPDVPVQPDNSHYKLSTTSEMEELDKNTKYEDGTYYGQYEGRRYTNPIQVIVTVDDGKITDVKKRQDKQIDDGSIYESIGFNGMIDILKKNQNPRNIRKQLNDLFAISKLIYDEGKSNGGSQEAYINATKKYLNNPDLSGIREGIQKDELLNIVKQNLLKKGYNKVDVVSGATYTGRGTVNAVVDALSKAKKDITINDFFIEGNFPHEYYTGDKLNLSGLKVRLEKKNGEKEIIPYNKFKENKLKIVERFSKEEISDNMTLDESVVGEEGLYLEILHTPTGSFKPLHVITVKKRKNYFPQAVLLSEKKEIVIKIGKKSVDLKTKVLKSQFQTS